MKKVINCCLILSSLFFVSCIVFDHIEYSSIESKKLKSYIPSFYIEGVIHDDKSMIHIIFSRNPYDSITVIKLMPILNNTDTMKLELGRYLSQYQRYYYDYIFKNSESLMKSQGCELIIDVFLYKNGVSQRYTDTVYVKEHKRHYYDRVNDFIPNLGH